MNPAKKIEIIANFLELGRILEGLDRSGVSGYTVLRNAIGRGAHGNASEDVTMLGNVYIIAVCSVEQVSQVEGAIAPILQKFGGICFVSDVQWLVP